MGYKMNKPNPKGSPLSQKEGPGALGDRSEELYADYAPSVRQFEETGNIKDIHENLRTHKSRGPGARLYGGEPGELPINQPEIDWYAANPGMSPSAEEQAIFEGKIKDEMVQHFGTYGKPATQTGLEIGEQGREAEASKRRRDEMRDKGSPLPQRVAVEPIGMSGHERPGEDPARKLIRQRTRPLADIKKEEKAKKKKEKKRRKGMGGIKIPKIRLPKSKRTKNLVTGGVNVTRRRSGTSQ